ncbi:MAG: four helix bundle protein [Fluviicola sp.]|jgi:four helix bundle protein|nr:four helix bundle protein [Fluviicola sp.]
MAIKRHNFRELKIWQESMKIVKSVYSLTSNLPSDERFGLVSQINRCSISIPSNIAEGSGRTSNKEFIHFLNISISSSFELETQLILANDLFNTDSEEIIEKINELQKMIVGFKKSLEVKYDSSLTSNF